MTTIITRLYSDSSAAAAAKASLLGYGLDEDVIHFITADVSGGAAAAMKAARVTAESAKAYHAAMTGGQALLVVQAPFNPVGTARAAIKVLRKHPALNVGLEDEDVYLREYPDARHANSVMKGGPLLMSNSFSRPSHGHILGSNPIMESKPRTSAMRGGGYMSKMFWPMKLVSAPKQGTSAIRGGKLFSSMFGLPLLTQTWSSREDYPTIIR
jgi:hypothetical protein